jgi:mannosyl-3-phosphoglycerate phosphatase
VKALFFTDIDGTLIDHNNYCHDGSIRGMELLHEKSIPLICISSKTFDEMSFLMKRLHLDYSFGFENGSGIAYYSEGTREYKIDLTGPGVDVLVEFMPELERISGKSLRSIISFSDDEIAQMTGLDLNSAALAKKRLTTLPFLEEENNLLTDSEIANLNEKLSEYSFQITKGGRFNHLIPSGSGKGEAVKKIIEFYKYKFKDEIVTAAAGDSLNDIPMLKSADYSYVIRKPGGGFINLMSGKIMNSSGPAGFTEAVNDFIKIIAG